MFFGKIKEERKLKKKKLINSIILLSRIVDTNDDNKHVTDLLKKIYENLNHFYKNTLIQLIL